MMRATMSSACVLRTERVAMNDSGAMILHNMARAARLRAEGKKIDDDAPSSAELLEIIKRARADRLRREAMDRYWQSVCAALPKPSEWPCTADRRCMASHHIEGCPIWFAEMKKGKK